MAPGFAVRGASPFAAYSHLSFPSRTSPTSAFAQSPPGVWCTTASSSASCSVASPMGSPPAGGSSGGSGGGRWSSRPVLALALVLAALLSVAWVMQPDDGPAVVQVASVLVLRAHRQRQPAMDGAGSDGGSQLQQRQQQRHWRWSTTRQGGLSCHTLRSDGSSISTTVCAREGEGGEQQGGAGHRAPPTQGDDEEWQEEEWQEEARAMQLRAESGSSSSSSSSSNDAGVRTGRRSEHRRTLLRLPAPA